MSIFLKLKHWQLFILFIVPVVIAANGSSLNYASRFLISVFVGGLFFGWLYSLGTALNNSIPPELRLNARSFKISFLLIIISHCSLSVARQLLEEGWWRENNLFIMLPVMLFMVCCVLNIFYFVAKSLNMAELKREALYKDYADEFFLLWFYPIGVWRIQPRINEIFKNET